MINSRKPLWLILALLTLAYGTAPAAGQVATADTVLRWKLKEGQAFDVVMKQNMEQRQDVGGQQIDTATEMEMKMTWEVTDVDDQGVMSIQQSIDRVAIKAQTPMGEIAYDSESQEEPEGMATMLAETMKPIIGVKFIQKLTPQGELSDPNQEGGEGGAPAGAPRDMLQQMMNSASLPFPANSLDAETKWDQETTTAVPQFGKVTMKREFSYGGEVERDSRMLHLINVTVDAQFQADPNAVEMTMDVTEQTGGGKLYFDNDLGYLVASEIDQQMNMVIEAMGQKIDQHQTSKMTMTVTPRS